MTEEAQEELVAEEPKPIEDSAPEVSEHELLLQSFSADFSGMLEKLDRESKLRATKGGLFIEESLLESCVSNFQNWYQEYTKTSAKLSNEKLYKKLFGEEFPPQFYVVEGKHSAVGYLIPCTVTSPHKIGVQLYHGQPLDAAGYLHPRDPLITALPNLDTKMGKQGMEFIFNLGKLSYLVPLPMLTEFAYQARESRRVCKDFPKLKGAMREALRAMPLMLSKSRPSRKKIPLLIPGRFRSNKELLFLCVGSFVFVVDQEQLVHACYDLKGKNRHEFVTAEFEVVKRMKRGPKVAGLELCKGRSPRFLAFYKLQSERYQLLPKAFGSFCEQLPMIKEFQNSLAPFYTIFDCVKHFSEIFMSSAIVDSRDVKKYLHDRSYRDLAYLRVSKRFVFPISKKRIILDCYNLDATNARVGKFKRKGKK